VRVVAGVYGGRRLEAPRGRSTRPTADRVREALFSILGPIDDARVLDLFAGSGALGIEALSRGAREAVFVDSDARAAAAIRRNLDALGIEPASVHRRDAFPWLRSAADGEEAFDLVFADPPYSSAGQTAARLSELLPPLLTDSSLIVTESDKRSPLELALPRVDERTYGDTRIAIHRGR
jgi:16S rRNA (guanine966-N2)-methyltransferase